LYSSAFLAYNESRLGLTGSKLSWLPLELWTRPFLRGFLLHPKPSTPSKPHDTEGQTDIASPHISHRELSRYALRTDRRTQGPYRQALTYPVRVTVWGLLSKGWWPVGFHPLIKKYVRVCDSVHRGCFSSLPE
jgi:hypothetical protein